MKVFYMSNTKIELLSKIIDSLEPSTDPDYNDPQGVENIDLVELGSKIGIVDRFYNSLRRAPLRKMLALIMFFADMVIIGVGLFLQKDLPVEIASGLSMVRLVIYGGYFGSSAAETISEKGINAKNVIQLLPELIELKNQLSNKCEDEEEE